MYDTPETKALVIGAGIGGLCAAIALEQAGLEVEVYERASELTAVGAGLSLWANALTALRHLDLAESVLARSVGGTQGHLRTWQGKIITELVSERAQERFGDLVVGIHRTDLQGLLLDTFGASRIHLGHELVGLEQTPQGVTAHFHTGARAKGALLVGADGLSSAARRSLVGQQHPHYAGYCAWRGVVPFTLEPEAAGESWGHGQRFGMLPLSGGRVYWFAVHSQAEGQRAPAGEKAKLLELFEGWHAPIPALIAATPEAALLRNDIYDRPPLKHWSRGRVTLLGDAAHPMTPNLGQGACQAIEDAVILGRALKRATPIPKALHDYETQRIGRTTRIVRQSLALGIVAQWSNPLLVALRQNLFKYVLPRLQDRQLESLVTFEV